MYTNWSAITVLNFVLIADHNVKYTEKYSLQKFCDIWYMHTMHIQTLN